MDFEKLIASIDHNTVDSLRRVVELGKFPDGRAVSAEQRALCMEAVLTWEAKHLPEEQRTGYIDRGSKAAGATCDDPAPKESTLKWADS